MLSYMDEWKVSDKKGTKLQELSAKGKNPIHKISSQQAFQMAHRQHIPITLPKAPWED